MVHGTYPSLLKVRPQPLINSHVNLYKDYYNLYKDAHLFRKESVLNLSSLFKAAFTRIVSA